MVGWYDEGRGHLSCTADLPICCRSVSRPPVALGVGVMAALHHELSAILSTAKAPDKLAEFLSSNGLTDIDQVGLLATDEDKLEEKVFPAMKEAGVPVDSLAQQIGIKKAWMLCRTRMSENRTVRTGATKEEDVLPAPTRENLTQSFKREHKFLLSGERLLTEHLIKQMYTEINSKPKKLSIYLLESLRVQSAITHGPRNLGVSRELKPGEPLMIEEVIADEVQSSIQIFERSRAFFSTIAYVCVNEPEWFSQQDLIFIEDKLLELLQWTKDKRRPPLSHFIAAWAVTLRFFSDEIRTSGRNLGALVRETSSWQSNWTSWTPPPTSSGTPSGASPAVTSSRVQELEKMLAEKRREAASLQSERDKLARRVNGRGEEYRSRGQSPRRPDHRQEDNRDRRQRSPRRKGDGGKGGKGGSQRRR